MLRNFTLEVAEVFMLSVNVKKRSFTAANAIHIIPCSSSTYVVVHM